MLPCLLFACCGPPFLQTTVGWVCVSGFGFVRVFTFLTTISSCALCVCLHMRRMRHG